MLYETPDSYQCFLPGANMQVPGKTGYPFQALGRSFSLAGSCLILSFNTLIDLAKYFVFEIC